MWRCSPNWIIFKYSDLEVGTIVLILVVRGVILISDLRVSNGVFHTLRNLTKRFLGSCFFSLVDLFSRSSQFVLVERGGERLVGWVMMGRSVGKELGVIGERVCEGEDNERILFVRKKWKKTRKIDYINSSISNNLMN